MQNNITSSLKNDLIVQIMNGSDTSRCKVEFMIACSFLLPW